MPYRRKKLTFAISSPDEFLLYSAGRRRAVTIRRRTLLSYVDKLKLLLAQQLKLYDVSSLLLQRVDSGASTSIRQKMLRHFVILSERIDAWKISSSADGGQRLQVRQLQKNVEDRHRHGRPSTIRYDTIRYICVRSKADGSSA